MLAQELFLGYPIYNGNWTEWSAIWTEIICLIWNHKYDFRPKLHNMKFNYHFITSILKLPNYRTWSVQIFYWCSIKLVWNWIHGGGGGIRVLETKVAKFATRYCLSFSCNLIGYFKQVLKSDWLFVLSVASSLATKKVQFKAKNGAICE